MHEHQEELRNFLKESNRFTKLPIDERRKVCVEYLGNAQAALHFTDLANCLDERQQNLMQEASRLIGELRNTLGSPPNP